MLKIKGAQQNPLIWVIVVVGILAVAGVINLPLVNQLTGKSTTSKSTQSTTSPATGTSTFPCGTTTGLAGIQVRYRNGASITNTDYRAVTLTAVDVSDPSNPQVYASYTPNSDGTYATTASALTCGKTFQVGVMNRPNAVAIMSAPTLINAPQVTFDVVGANSSQIAGNMYSLAYGNETNTSTAFATGSQDFQTNTPTRVTVGNTLTVRFDVKTVNGSSQFGSVERICETDSGVCGRAFVCQTGATSTYSNSALSMSAPFVVQRLTTLPRMCQLASPSNAGVGLDAYEINAIKSSDGTQTGTYTVRADLATTGSATYVRNIYMDNSYYQGAGNKLKVGTGNDAGTDNGDINRYMEIILN